MYKQMFQWYTRQSGWSLKILMKETWLQNNYLISRKCPKRQKIHQWSLGAQGGENRQRRLVVHWLETHKYGVSGDCTFSLMNGLTPWIVSLKIANFTCELCILRKWGQSKINRQINRKLFATPTTNKKLAFLSVFRTDEIHLKNTHGNIIKWHGHTELPK